MTRSLLLAVFAIAACGDANSHDDPPKLRPATVVPTTTAAVEAKPTAGSAEEPKKRDESKGDKEDSEWVPNEHKQGMARWKDIGVYVDGIPVGFLSWGELPVSMPVTWIKDKVSARKRPGTNDPGWKWAQQRFYKFTDYLKAVGVDVRKITEIHVYGPKLSQTLIVSGKELSGPRASEFLFRFGADTGGKAIPQAPGDFGNGKTADKITSVSVYITKKPPTLIRNAGLELDGVMQTGVPYYGDPVRGGVRIYLDDKLAAIIKRQELDVKKAVNAGQAGEPVFKLSDVFAAQGVDTRKVVEAWVIRDERFNEKISAADFANLTFTAGAQAKGGVLLGDNKYKANAISLHTRALADKDIPRPTEWDD